MKSFTCDSHPGPSGPPNLLETSASSEYSAHQAYSDGENFPNLASSRPKRKTGRKIFRETRHPVYRGVRRRNESKWVCEVREPNKKSRIWLGTFPNPEMAARAHDVAAMALNGRSAILNFADSAWLLPLPASASPKDIQKAAAEAAKAFPSTSCSHTVFKGNDVTLENSMHSPENVVYVDDEVIFGMPGLLASMAEGLLVSPPSFDQSGFHWDDVDCNADLSLWSYSV